MAGKLDRGNAARHVTLRQLAPVVIAAALAGGAGFLLASSNRGAATTAAPTPSTSAIASAPPAEAPAPPLASAVGTAQPASLLERAKSGDLTALKELELRPAAQRTPDEALAITAGHAALARKDGARLAADLAKDPSLFGDRSTMAFAYRLALDPDVTPSLLADLARLDDPRVADLLFDLATRGEPGARLTLLAEDLLGGPAVRPEVSNAVAIALEIRSVQDCSRLLALLPRVSASADDRAVPLLARFRERKGCGPKNEDDCWSCLREGENERRLDEAEKAAGARPFDPPWRLRAPQRSK